MYKLKDDSSNNSEGLWAFNTRDLMRAATCDHCIKLAIAKELDMPGVRALLEPYALEGKTCLLYTSPSPRDRQKSRMPSSA